MIQHVLPRRAGPRTEAERPRDTLTGLAQQEWSAYRAHPWLVTVLASTRPPLSPAVLDSARQYVDAFSRLGVDPAAALGRYLALSAYIQGMALLLVSAQQEAVRSQQSDRAWWSEQLARLERTQSPRYGGWVAEVSGGGVPDTAGLEDWFQDGLRRVVAGLTGADP